MILLRDVKLPLGYSEKELRAAVEKRVFFEPFSKLTIIKRSIDARKKPSIFYTLSVVVEAENEGYILAKDATVIPFTPAASRLSDLKLAVKKTDKRIAVIGTGPAGLFAALTLAEYGVKPIIIERGSKVDERVNTNERFIKSGVLSAECNVQFGEGGAGTFSDGKLTTGTSSPLIDIVKGTFVQFGASEDILVNAKPHIGTDYLRRIIKNIRQSLISKGAEFLFDTKVVGFKTQNGRLTALELVGKEQGVLAVDAVVLAVGHSARDTFEKLLEAGVILEPKPFSIGVRIEHERSAIDFSQYGISDCRLPAADYKLSCHLDNGRSVYTFCMCPAGEVICASSEEGGIVTNGMSNFARDGANSNSALLVNVTPADFSGGVLAGVEFQRKYERLAYGLSGSYKCPVQLVGDFKRNKVSSSFGRVKPTVGTGTTFADLRECLPTYVSSSLKTAIDVFNNRLKGFNDRDSLLVGVETRSSSPVRILRDEKGESNVSGLYPCGEGAGYAGGITSSAVDGINTAIAILKSL